MGIKKFDQELESRWGWLRLGESSGWSKGHARSNTQRRERTGEAKKGTRKQLRREVEKGPRWGKEARSGGLHWIDLLCSGQHCLLSSTRPLGACEGEAGPAGMRRGCSGAPVTRSGRDTQDTPRLVRSCQLLQRFGASTNHTDCQM